MRLSRSVMRFTHTVVAAQIPEFLNGGAWTIPGGQFGAAQSLIGGVSGGFSRGCQRHSPLGQVEQFPDARVFEKVVENLPK